MMDKIKAEHIKGKYVGCNVIVIEKGTYEHRFGMINKYTLSGTKEGFISLLVGHNVGGGVPLIEVDKDVELRGDEYHWVEVKEAIDILNEKCNCNKSNCSEEEKNSCKEKVKNIIKKCIETSPMYIKEELTEEINIFNDLI
jgi:hypothetical protein